ncbi:hypothetical protein [Streptomyces sp. NRRL S-237]|uniref:hypothetical protein n=1 Tax=Streptomyces sp. NRRL S-237 TaxID=1463895 RepID=UPI0018FF15B8|nr:hypothetical protein [Streptomyces sp. NRRL S-237]
MLSLLLEASADDPPWATRMSEQAGLGKSTVSQILARLAALAWLVLRDEQGPHPGRPPRVFCTLTREGRRQAEVVLAARDGRRQRRTEKPTGASMTREIPTQEEARRPVQADPSASRVDEMAVRRQQSHPRMRGHWPIDFSSLKMRFAAATAPSEEGNSVPEGDSVVQLTALREAFGTLRSINRNLTKSFLARSAVAPAHGMEHEEIVRDILMEATEIRGKALRAHNH